MEEVSWDQGFMFYSYCRREQRKALHTGTHPAAVVRRFKIDPGTNGQQEPSSSQRLVSIRLNRPHIHYHISSQSAADLYPPLWDAPLLFVLSARLIQRLPALTTVTAVDCYVTAVCNGSANTFPRTTFWGLLFGQDVL